MRAWTLALMLWLMVGWTEATHAKEVYKLQVASGGGSGLSIPLPIPISIDTSRQEWVVITVDQQNVTVFHTTSVANFIGLRTWHDHPAIMIRICVNQGFEQINCQTTEGDTAALPEGKTIYDITLDFQYIESGVVITRSVHLAPDFKPES